MERGFSTRDVRGLQFHTAIKYAELNVLVPAIYVGCSTIEKNYIRENILFQYPRYTWVVVGMTIFPLKLLLFQYPRCTWVVVIYMKFLKSYLRWFQYPRCTWVVVDEIMEIVIRAAKVLVPTMHVSCSCYHKIKQRCYVGVLVPTMHVGCSPAGADAILANSMSFSTHDARGLQQALQITTSYKKQSFSTHDARGLQYAKLYLHTA